MRHVSAAIPAARGTSHFGRLIVPLGLCLILSLAASGCGQAKKAESADGKQPSAAVASNQKVKLGGNVEKVDDEPEEDPKAQTAKAEQKPAKAEEKPAKPEEKPAPKPADKPAPKPAENAQAGGSPRPAGNAPENTQAVQFPDGDDNKPVDNANRVRETVVAGKTYTIVQKYCVNVQITDQESGGRIKLGELGEAIVTRTIESNDGKRIVEVRHVQAVRQVKVISAAADFNVDLGTPDKILLSSLDSIPPNSQGDLSKDDMKVVIDAVVKDGAGIANAPSTKVRAYVHGMTGKKVRMTSIDGMGVQTIEPIDCSLTPSERRYFHDRDPLFDARLMLPDFGLKPGREVTIPGTAFQEAMPPSWNPRTSGKVVIAREDDTTEGGKSFAVLIIKSPDSVLKMSASDKSSLVYGSFKASGKLRCDMTDHYVRDAVMDGDIRIEAVPKGSTMKNATFVSEPKISIMYYCNRN